MLTNTTAAFNHCSAIKVHVHCDSLDYDVERRFIHVILRDCCTSLEFFLYCLEYASVFNLMTSSCLKEFLQACFRSYLIVVLFRIVVWSVVLNELSNPERERASL